MKTYNYLKQSIGGYIEVKSPKIFGLLNEHRTGVKYILSGGTAVVVNLSFLYFFTEVFELWYVTSSILAFFISLLTGFSLQKFWTFRDNNVRHIKRQIAMYSAVGVLNLVLGPVLLYALVEAFGIWYMLGQVAVMIILAGESYLINRFKTFKKGTTHEGINA